MLMAGGVEPPRLVFAHGFLTVGGEKMSKTNLTGIHPFELIDLVGVDAYRYFFMREIQFGQDGNFSQEALEDRYTADLANGLGNLASRVLAMIASNLDGVIPDADPVAEAGDLPALVEDVARRYDEAMERVAPTQALAAVWEIVDRANGYLVERAPWALAKDPSKRAELEGVLAASAEVLRVLAVFISPIMPDAAARLWSQLGIGSALEEQRLPEASQWGLLEAGTQTKRGDALFPRLDA
jgi:methionyl-tRNA synthetase